jgi:hypothetical protein
MSTALSDRVQVAREARARKFVIVQNDVRDDAAIVQDDAARRRAC